MAIFDQFRLSGKVAVITGSGQGIGRQIALAYAEAGADIVCTARSQEDIEAVAEQARQWGGRALAISCDVTDAEQRQALVEKTNIELGQITHLVNNAGGGGPNSPLEMSAAEFQQRLDFNITSCYALCQLIAPQMIEQGEGNIINITSAAARYAQQHFSSYGTAKAGQTQLTRLLAQDFAPHIRVNGIAPGPILTPALEREAPAEMISAMASNTPLKRLGSTQDIANAALFLASPASAWITGKIIEVDGGAEATVWPG